MSRARLPGNASLSVVLLTHALCFAAPARASELQRALEAQVDSLEPTHANRHLKTTDVHVLVAEKRVDTLPFTLRFGVTLSRPSGSITQLEGDFNQGTLHEQTFASSAWGFGPVMQQRLRILHWSDLRLSADLGEGVLWYDHDFPSGGRRYDFMLQTGPTIAFAHPGNRFSVSIGYRWMHVSNGSGIGPQNPSYEARGPMLGVGYALHVAR